MELSEDDVLEILKLFQQSEFDFLELQHGERKITVSKRGFAVPGSSVGTAAVPRPAAPADPAKAAVPPTGEAAAAQHAAKQEVAPAAGLVAVVAPMVGKFYAAPSPSDPPYVSVGSRVAVGATVGLIEVMKVFTSIKTETAGVIEKILVSNGEFVEFGQTLFLIRADA